MKKRLNADKRYLVHVYKVNFGPVTFKYVKRAYALAFAHRSFKTDGVYKVKVWDRRIGDPVPNVTEHEALILELV